MRRRGLIINNYDTAAHRFTLSALHLALPEVTTNFVAIPGMSGRIDATETINGLTYGTRELTATLELSTGTMHERRSVLDEFFAAFHGQRCTIQHPDHPGWQLSGRLAAAESLHSLAYSEIGITATCDPFFVRGVQSSADLPIYPGSENLARFSALSINRAASTGTPNFISETSVVFPTLTVKGTFGQLGVFQLSGLEPGKEYYVAGRLCGIAQWSASGATTKLQDFAPFVTASADGCIYITIQIRQATGLVLLNDVICVDSAKVQKIRNTEMATLVTALCPQASLETVVVAAAGTSCPHNHRTASFALPAGETPVVALRAGSTAGDVDALTWARRKL